MKKIVYIICLIFLISCDDTNSDSSQNPNNQSEIPTTDQNGNSFSITSIGDQTWMAENLRVDKFRNGDIIPQVTSIQQWDNANQNGQPVWCYFNFSSSNGATYGKIYNWSAVIDSRGLAPEGWHIPYDVEWLEL